MRYYKNDITPGNKLPAAGWGGQPTTGNIILAQLKWKYNHLFPSFPIKSINLDISNLGSGHPDKLEKPQKINEIYPGILTRDEVEWNFLNPLTRSGGC